MLRFAGSGLAAAGAFVLDDCGCRTGARSRRRGPLARTALPPEPPLRPEPVGALLHCPAGGSQPGARAPAGLRVPDRARDLRVRVPAAPVLARDRLSRL